jgi:hypothetical protein
MQEVTTKATSGNTTTAATAGRRPLWPGCRSASKKKRKENKNNPNL